jgi:hypothetical protein
MDERKPGRAESSPEQPVHSEGRAMLEQAFARGSSQIAELPPPTPERTEHSVMVGLPPDKVERIAAMRRELAELQRQLTDAQQRIATELQGRAEDAERLEALEGRLQAHEVKAQEDSARTAELVAEVASLRSQLTTVTATAEELRREAASRETLTNEAKTLLEARTAELAARTSELAARTSELEARTAERDTELVARARLEAELEEQRKQQREATTQLESQAASLRDANALVATRDAELAAITSERDVLKGELAAARARARDVATQLTRFGQELLEGGDAATGSSSEPPPTSTARNVDRPKPPPVPPPRAAAATEPPKVEAILEVTEEPRSKSRSGLLLISGVILGSVAMFAFVSWRSTSPVADPKEAGDSPTAALVSEHASEPATPSALPEQIVASPSAPSAQPTLGSDDGPSIESGSPAAAAGEATTTGVLVLPKEADDHRVFVDDRVVRVKSLRAVVPCGKREIKIGSRGIPRTLDVACGGETEVPAN